MDEPQRFFPLGRVVHVIKVSSIKWTGGILCGGLVVGGECCKPKNEDICWASLQKPTNSVEEAGHTDASIELRWHVL